MKYALIGCGRIATNHVKAVLNNGLEFTAANAAAAETKSLLVSFISFLISCKRLRPGDRCLRDDLIFHARRRFDKYLCPDIKIIRIHCVLRRNTFRFFQHSANIA